MKSTIKQYRPAFFTGFENENNQFESVFELINIKWVDNFIRWPNGDLDPKFHQFSISVSDDHNDVILMAEYNEGYSWFVVGYIDKIDHVRDLPEWKPKYKK